MRKQQKYVVFIVGYGPYTVIDTYWAYNWDHVVDILDREAVPSPQEWGPGYEKVVTVIELD